MARAIPGLVRSIELCLGVGLVLSYATPSAAQDCDCDHVVPLDVDTAVGTDLGVAAGDVVCIEAGARSFLVLESFVGSADAPVVIQNCGGPVQISNADRGYGLLINGSSFFHLTGTGDPSVEYGFDVSASRTGPDYAGSGVPVGDLSTDYEIDHVEVHHTGFAGFILKTESRCDGSANLGQFVQRNTRVHHCYVHDTGGEGFYVGSTGYGGREFQCDGQSVTLYPHEHHGVWLHDNLIADTGWDGLQVGVTPEDCEVYRNVILRVGRSASDSVQTRGIQIGGASACQLYDNILMDGPTIGIFVLGAADTLVRNNVVANFGETGIYGNDQEQAAVAGSSYLFVHNTIVGSGEGALSLFGDLTAGNAVVNNLLVETTGTPLGVGGNVDALVQGNLERASLAEAGFVDAASRDFHLTADSPARDVGAVSTGFDVERDLDGVLRDSAPDVGAYEYTEEPRPDGGVPIGEGGAAGQGGNPSGAPLADSEASNCGCRAAGVAPRAPAGMLATASLLLVGLRRAARSRRAGPRQQRPLRSGRCGHLRLVAFSCKRRGFCPSCRGRRCTGDARSASGPESVSEASDRNRARAHRRPVRHRPVRSPLDGTHGPWAQRRSHRPAPNALARPRAPALAPRTAPPPRDPTTAIPFQPSRSEPPGSFAYPQTQGPLGVPTALHILVVAFAMLTGKLPFEASSLVELVRMHASEPPPRALEHATRSRHVSRRTASGLLEKDRNARPQTVDEAFAGLRGATTRAGHDISLPSYVSPRPPPPRASSPEASAVPTWNAPTVGRSCVVASVHSPVVDTVGGTAGAADVVIAPVAGLPQERRNRRRIAFGVLGATLAAGALLIFTRGNGESPTGPREPESVSATPAATSPIFSAASSTGAELDPLPSVSAPASTSTSMAAPSGTPGSEPSGAAPKPTTKTTAHAKPWDAPNPGGELEIPAGR